MTADASIPETMAAMAQQVTVSTVSPKKTKEAYYEHDHD
jgi:hypothetical protein